MCRAGRRIAYDDPEAGLGCSNSQCPTYRAGETNCQPRPDSFRPIPSLSYSRPSLQLDPLRARCSSSRALTGRIAQASLRYSSARSQLSLSGPAASLRAARPIRSGPTALPRPGPFKTFATRVSAAPLARVSPFGRATRDLRGIAPHPLLTVTRPPGQLTTRTAARSEAVLPLSPVWPCHLCI